MRNLAQGFAKELPTNVDSSDVYMSMGSAESLDVIGTGEVKAQGVFKVLDIAVYNRKEEPITLDINNFKLIDGFGREYHISNEYQSVLKAQIRLHLNLVLLTLMNIRTETLYSMYRKHARINFKI